MDEALPEGTGAAPAVDGGAPEDPVESARRTLERLRELLARGASLRKAAVELSIDHTWAHRLAVEHNLPRRTKLSDAQREQARAMLAERVPLGRRRWTLAEIAAAVGCHKQSIWRLSQAEQDDGASLYRCPGCGHLVYLDPCVICDARAARASAAAG